MEEERAEKLRGLLDTGLHQLYGLWDEIGENQYLKVMIELFLKGPIHILMRLPLSTT